MNNYMNIIPNYIEISGRKIKLTEGNTVREVDLQEMSININNTYNCIDANDLRMIAEKSTVNTISIPVDKCFDGYYRDSSEFENDEVNFTSVSKNVYTFHKYNSEGSIIYINAELPITQTNRYSKSEKDANMFNVNAMTTTVLNNNNKAFVYSNRDISLIKNFVDLIDCESNHDSQITKALNSYNENAYYIDLIFNQQLPGGSDKPDDDDDNNNNKPTTEKPTLPTLVCEYGKLSYRFIKNEKTYYIKPIPDDNTIVTYDVKCDNDTITIKENGEFQYTSNEIKKITCNINCFASGYQNGSTSVIFETIDYKPTVLEVVYPAMVNKSKLFNASIILSYPSIDNLNDTENDNEESESLFTKKEFTFKLSLEENDYNFTLLSEEENVKGEEKFNFYNYYINNSMTEKGIHDVNLKFEGNSSDKSITISETRKIKVMVDYECRERFGFDADGVCCKRNTAGELCTNIKTTYKFDATDGGSAEFREFRKEFVKLIAPIFNGTHFFEYDDTKESDLENNKIVISVRYISDRNNTKDTSRLLQDSPASFKPMDFIKAVMMAIGPTEKNNDNPNEDDNGDDLLDEDIKIMAESMGINTDTFTNALKDTNDQLKESCTTFKFRPSADFRTIETESSDSKEIIEEKKDSWIKKYWWVILIISVVVVLLIIIMSVIVYSRSKKTKELRELEKKQQKIKEKEIPIEKIVEVNSVNEEDLYVPYFHEIIMEGYLLKQGRKNLGKWQKRYCVLYSKLKTFRIYESMTPSYGGNVYLNEKQDIPMDCYNGIEYKEGSNEFTLVLKIRESSFKTYESGNDERKIHFKCEGNNKVEETKKWVESFKDFNNKKPIAVEAWTRPVIVDKENKKIIVATNKAEAKKNENSIESALKRKNRKTLVPNKKKPVSSFIPSSLMVKVGVYVKPE